MSLRRRLVLVTVGVVAIALAAADVGAYVALRSSLVARAQEDLAIAAKSSIKIVVDPVGSPKAFVSSLSAQASNLAFVFYDPKGALIDQASASGNDKVLLPPPVLADPAVIPRIWSQVASSAANKTGLAPADATILVPAASGGFQYAVTAVETIDGGIVVIALPLNEVAATLGQLAVVVVLVTLAVIAFVAVAATRLIAVALRPLTAIEDTAARIAAGDLEQRIAQVDRRTEVGRLGIALNTMLGRIAVALAAREASEQRLRQLVTDASHELRTPLTSLRGYAELFRRGADERPADLARAMRGIEAESQRMGTLVDELLMLARLDEGQPLPATEEDLVPVVRSAVDAARVVEPDRRLELVVPPSAFVLADATRLRQVADNLLANVRVHTPRGTPARVTVAAEGSRWVLAVADEGPGMTESARQHVFERFFRADPSRSRDRGGSGLGLAIVAAIAHATGGDVAVTSEPGHGATFSVGWPRIGPPADGPAAGVGGTLADPV